MSTLYITEEGCRLSRTDERIKVIKGKQTLLDLPLMKVGQIVILGEAYATGSLIAALLERGIGIAYLTRHGRFVGRLEPAFSKNVLLRKAQYEAAFDAERSLEIAKYFIAGKLANLRTTLVRANRDREEEKIEAAISQIKAMESGLKEVGGINALMGIEGSGTGAYFSVFGRLIRTPDFEFSKRIRRPPKDPVNALLSFGYALLFGDLLSACSVVGFDPYVGYLHTDRYGRASLALDLMEEFRPLIVDSVVLTCLNKRVLTKDDFQEELGSLYRLTDEGRKKFLVQYEGRKNTEIKHPVFGYRTTYFRTFDLQARLLAKFLEGEIKAYPPFVTR